MNYILNSKSVALKNKYKIGVLIHLYYYDSVSKYEKYIKNIPKQVDILITYSDQKVLEQLQNIKSEMTNQFVFIEKKNRGRDISALLVAARKYILNYDIICFIHDKKSKNKVLEEDTEKWIYSLWENSLSSESYIKNVLSIFEKKDNVGVLTPPIYCGDIFSAEIINQWGANYEILRKMFEDTKVKKIPSQGTIIKAFGTVFWARVDALKKLLYKDWKYDDFDDEPLADDGTISHAIERSICFYAEDAGYECHTIMTKEYAELEIQKIYGALFNAIQVLNENFGCRNLKEIRQFDNKKEELKEFCLKQKKVYIYGAGKYGKTCLNVLRMLNIQPCAFIVTSKVENFDEVDCLPVIELQKDMFDKETGIIIAVSEKNRRDILELLFLKIDIKNIYFF